MMNINSCLDLHTLGFRNSAPRCARLHRRALHMARGRVDDGGALGSCVKGRKGAWKGGRGCVARRQREGGVWLIGGGEEGVACWLGCGVKEMLGLPVEGKTRFARRRRGGSQEGAAIDSPATRKKAVAQER